MKKIYLPHLLFVLLLSSGFVHAQESTFDPALFFPDNIEIIDTEVIENTIAPYVRWDDESREVTVFFSDHIAHYPYPEEVVSFYEQARPIWQNRAVLTGYGQDGSESSESYIVNMQTGDITRYEQHCGENSPQHMFGELAQDLWVLEVTPEGIVLCATLTGERTPSLALPDDFVPMEHFGTYNSLSPDFTRVLFLGDKGEVYLYTFSRGQATHLGTLKGDEWRIGSFFWVDNQHFILSSRADDLCLTYMIEVNQADELTPGWETSPECAYPVRDTQGHVTFSELKSVGEDSPFYTLTQAIYDLKTGEWQSYDYGTLGYADYGSMDGEGYYRAVSDDLKSAAIVRFNPVTGERETIFEGREIEWVRWVSADERFAVLLLDNNGKIDRIPGTYSETWYGIENPMLVVVELATGSVRYAIPVPWDDFTYDVISDITMLREDLLLVEMREYEITPSLGDSWITTERLVQTQLVQLTDGDPIITEIGRVLAVMPGKNRLLIWAEVSDPSTEVYVYDLATGSAKPILKAVDYESYQVSLVAGDRPDTAIVTVYPVVNGIIDRHQGVRYTIRF